MRSFFCAGILSIAFVASVQAEVLIGVAGPMSGANAWPGEQMQRGAELAVMDINTAGGVLGEHVRLLTADDFCDPDQGVAAARKLVSDGAIFVAGHYCSGASIPASSIYEKVGVLMISPASSNPTLTELGRANVFRVIIRDDADGVMDGNYLADNWKGPQIAILHDNTVFGKGLADSTREQLSKRGVTEAIYKSFEPGKSDYSAEIVELQSANIAVLYVGGYQTEMGLLIRAARDRGYNVQLVTGSGVLATEEFGLIAGPAAEGTRFTSFPDPRLNPNALEVIKRFRADGFDPEGYTLLTYAAIQTWAAAVDKAGSLELQAVIVALRENEFTTVIGPIAFDTKGDITTQTPVWYVWKAGTYVPIE
ncbi:branched-chain amino acid ABC transporter substrate-binding protein [Pararhizobium sp. PWRC1-1]|uniref:branched-chain amino acid ABC transporter substrate-binding protein n=1 Tax=Pararhizobium sp. PWRC1-1 TaxID=2804566 RepID=UPI003CF7EDA9